MQKVLLLILCASFSACSSSRPSTENSADNSPPIQQPAPPGPAPVPAPAPGPAPVPAPTPGAGNTIAAADCSFSAVQSAVRGAKAGTTILVPAGDCNWGSSSLLMPGGTHINGSGKNATIIRRGGSVDSVASLLRFDCASGSAPVAVSNLQLVGRGTVGTDDMGIRVERNCTQDFRIYNNKLSKFTFAAININGSGGTLPPRGVIYNNEIVNNYTIGRGNLGYGVVVYANNQSGNLSATLGSPESVFIEDNIFSGNRHSVAANAAARYVFRYNKVITTNEVKDWGQVDAHGTTDTSSKSTFSWEIYNNAFTSTITDGGDGWAMFMRGGDGVVFNNTYGSSVKVGVGLTLEKGCSSGTYPAPDQTRSVHIWGNSKDTVAFYSGDGDCTKFFQQNRDYYFAARPGYTPYTYPHPAKSQ